jgi:DNA-binding GntR family transcriptional regulator
VQEINQQESRDDGDQNEQIVRTSAMPKQTIADHIYSSIRRDLMECRWPAGHTLKIRTLAAEFGVSAMPVRLALKRLGEEGALTVSENRSARVPFISQQRFSEFYEITVRLETLALERAFQRINADQLKALIDRADETRLDIEGGQIAGYAQRFNSILMELYRIGGSSALIEFIENAWVNVAPPSNAVFEAPMFVTKIHAHLLEILQAFRRKDLDAAVMALVAALSYAERAMNLLMDMEHTSRPLNQKRPPKEVSSASRGERRRDVMSDR